MVVRQLAQRVGRAAAAGWPGRAEGLRTARVLIAGEGRGRAGGGRAVAEYGRQRMREPGRKTN